MNAKQYKRLRKSLRAQGINPKDTVYISERDVLRNNLQPLLSTDPSIFKNSWRNSFHDTVLLYKECGRAVYQGMKAAFKALK
jgi:hypothetical protein